MSNKETWNVHKIQIEILSPVIINTGEVYEYGELFIDPNNKLFKINITNLIQLMTPENRTEYIDIVSEGIATRDIKYDESAKRIVLETIKNNSGKINQIISRPMGLLSSGEYLLNKKPFQAINKSCVKKINEKPYIPGSSIKGVLRTALIQSVLDISNIRRNDYIRGYKYIKNKSFELNTLQIKDIITEDPFKYIKVSDFEFENSRISNYVGQVLVSTKKKPLPVYTTMTDALCISDRKVIVKGSISISSKLLNIGALKRFYNIKNILEALNNFYIDNYNNKSEKLPSKVKSNMSNLINENLKENKALIKIGRFSGIENITYNLIQDTSINGKIYNENINIEGGDSYSLIENKYIPGYCIISEA